MDRASFSFVYRDMTPTDERITRSLIETRVIAMVGASPRAGRASNSVGHYLVSAGFRVIPVNPIVAGETLFGEKVVSNLSEIETPVQLLNIFRRSEAVLPHVAEAIAALPDLKTVWMQLGVANSEARLQAESAGPFVVEDRCIKIEHARLIGARA